VSESLENDTFEGEEKGIKTRGDQNLIPYKATNRESRRYRRALNKKIGGLLVKCRRRKGKNGNPKSCMK